MPDVEIAYVVNIQLDWFKLAAVLKKAVVDEFPLDGRTLDPDTEIDIEFRERFLWDQPLANIRITIEAHSTPERVRRSDAIARAIRLAVEKVVDHWNVDVRVRLSEVGYSSESYDGRKLRSGIDKTASSLIS